MSDDLYLNCPICDTKVGPKNFSKHLRRQHIDEVGLDRIKIICKEMKVKDLIVILKMKERQRAILEENRIVKCSICSARVKKKDQQSHQKQPNCRPRLCDLPPSVRRKYLNDLDRPDHRSSNDVLDHWRTQSGGGFGVGKGKRS